MASIADEAKFQDWYRRYAQQLGLSLNPDDPEHYYDWRAAWQAGATPDRSGHWPSQFKAPGHPNRYVEGMDTITGMPDFRNVQGGKSNTIRDALLMQMNMSPGQRIYEGDAGGASRMQPFTPPPPPTPGTVDRLPPYTRSERIQRPMRIDPDPLERPFAPTGRRRLIPDQRRTLIDPDYLNPRN